MQVTVTGVRAYPCTQAIAAYLRVKYDATYGLELAGAGDEDLGTVNDGFIVLGLGKSKSCPVVTPNSHDTIKMVADGVIAYMGDVYAGALGKVSASGTIYIGVNIGKATTADGDYCEILRKTSGLKSAAAGTGTTGTTWTANSDAATPKVALYAPDSGTGNYTMKFSPPATLTGNRTILGLDADDTLVLLTQTQTLTNKTLTAPVVNSEVLVMGTNTSGINAAVAANKSGQTYQSTAAIKLTLPAATVGLNYNFRAGSAHALTVGVQAGEYMGLPSTGVLQTAGKGVVSSGAKGESVGVVCFATGEWTPVGYTGTWIAES